MEKINFPGLHISSHFSRFSDGDPANIVYFANHAIYFDEAFIQMSQKKNYSWENRKDIYLIPIVEQNVKFISPLPVSQKIIVLTAITHIGFSSFRSNHVIYVSKDDEYKLISHGYLNRVSVDANSFKSMEIPSELKSILQEYKIPPKKWDDYISQL